MKLRPIAFVVATFACVQAVAQSVPATMQDPQSMMKAMADAQAAASRPGDEKLGCDELQAELATTMNDPQLQSTVQAAGEKAQQDVAAMEAAKGEAAATTAGTVASSLVPGAAMPAMAAAAAANQAKGAQAAERVQSHAEMAGQMTENLPTIMRGQRLVELATAKKCEWIAGFTDAPPEP